MNALGAPQEKPETGSTTEMWDEQKAYLDAQIAEAESELQVPCLSGLDRQVVETSLAATRRKRRTIKWALPAVVVLALILILVLVLTGPWEGDSAVVQQGQASAAGQDTAAKPQPAAGQTDAPAGAADASRTWLFTSRPEGWDHYNPDWHIVFAGPLEAGTISMWEDKTVTGTYRLSGDTLVIDLTRLIANTLHGTLPQKFHYEMTGYPGETMEGSVMIGRIDPEEPEWPQTVPARAER
jgi:hypothetical protein